LIKTVRFDIGELDEHVPAIRQLPAEDPLAGT